MLRLLLFGLLFYSLTSVCLKAQLPADAVILSKVKIAEKQKSMDLCPVHLVASDADLPTFKHDGIAYRGHNSDCVLEFEKDPKKYVGKARYQRWENNFISAMSIIWCPVTDEVNPGGRKQWKKLGIDWESCCKFCDEDYTDEDFEAELKLLKKRAMESYKATKGTYVEGAKSPVEGAIKDPDEEQEKEE